MPILSHKQIEEQLSQACEFHSVADFDAAETIYLRLLELIPDSGMLNYNIGLLFFETSKYERASHHYMKALESAPKDPDVLFNLALCQKKLGVYSVAIKTFNELLTVSPNDWDGYYNLGNCYIEQKNYEKARSAFSNVLVNVPDHLSANRNLAYVHHLLGDTEKALSCYRKVLDLDPNNSQATHMVASITGENVTSMPASYIKDIFDDYSASFDTDLLNVLEYEVPTKLKEKFDSLDFPVGSFERCIDLGCGTGLAGLEFKGICKHLTGIDLSEKMVAKAKGKNIYDITEAAEIVSYLTTDKNEYDFAIAADVLTYVGDLEPIFKVLISVTSQGALFCFSTENSAMPGFQLGTTGRFVHSQEYVIETASQTGWQLVEMEKTRLRKEKDEWVYGTLYFLTKS